MNYQIADAQDYELANEQYKKDTAGVLTVDEMSEEFAKASNLFFGDKPSEEELAGMLESFPINTPAEQKLLDHACEMGEEGV